MTKLPFTHTRALLIVSKDLHKELRMHAAAHDKTIRQVVEGALRDFLQQQEGK